MPIPVLLVDDSAVIRGLMDRALSNDPDIHVAGTAANGQLAISMAKELQPSIIVLDIEMPVMDGLTALPELLKVSPASKVIMASTLTVRNASISMQALALGAVDYLAKPSSKEKGDVENFYRELTGKIKALGVSKPLATAAAKTVVAPPPPPKPTVVLPTPPAVLNPSGVRALAIASSTGGPQALLSLFTQIKGRVQHVPIFITQHMPATFTKILAEHISKAGERLCVEAQGGEEAKPGQVYLAPGDFHMVAEKNGIGKTILRINQDAPENFCRPAADPMLRSLSHIYGSQLLVAVLTGMGQDGMLGSKEVVKAGGSVIAQDEATCVVYGMPRAIVEHKLAKAVLPLPQMGDYLAQQIDGRR